MNVREHMKEIRLSRARLEALTQRRGRCVQMGAFHSEGGSDALERLRREIDRRIDAVAEQTLAAERLIDTVSDANQRDVLRYRYLDGWEWKEIARRMNYSTDWVKHVHGKALKAMERALGTSGVRETGRRTVSGKVGQH